MVLKEVLVLCTILCSTFCIHAVVIHNIQDYCTKGPFSTVTCQGLIFDEFEEVEFDINNKLSAESIIFENSRFNRIPKNAFRITQPVEFIMKGCAVLEISRSDFDSGINNTITEKLNLQYNFIERIPGKVFELLPKLKYLSLSGNRLTTLGPDCFVGLENLNTLYIDTNNIQTLRHDVLNPLKNLEEIWMYYNQLDYLPRTIFSNNKKLRNIDLSNNNLKIIDVNVIKSPVALEYMLQNFNESVEPTNIDFLDYPQVQEIYLSYNFVPYISRHSFAKVTNLQSFTADNCHLTTIESGAFSGKKDLTSLSLEGNLLKSFDLNQLSTMKELMMIYFQSNLLTEFDYRLLDNNPALYTVSLAGNPFPCELNNEILQYFKNRSIRIDLGEATCGKAKARIDEGANDIPK